MGEKVLTPDSFEALPGRVFLDTCVVNFCLDYGEQIHDGAGFPEDISPRAMEDIDALTQIWLTGSRANWQLSVSPLTYVEVSATKDPGRSRELNRWFWEIWSYWREFLHADTALPSFSEAEEIRLRLLKSAELQLLPDINDRILLCDAAVYDCDAFCTRDWSTILRHRESLRHLPFRILTPTEWWAEIRPWAAIWW